MPKDIHVLLIEDDPYARDLMSMLLARDWRTRVLAEAGSEADVQRTLHSPSLKIDAILLDTEVPGDPDWPFRMAEIARASDPEIKVVCTATKGNTATLKRVVEDRLGGYLVKPEIGYALAAAVSIAAKQHRFVSTPGAYTLALQERIALPPRSVILDGRKSSLQLTPRETEIARLAILFNHSYRDLSDELLIRADQVAKHVSNVYTKLGLDEFLAGEIEPEFYLEDPLILQRFRSILQRVAASPARRKTADMATLAFHLLTVPELRELE